MEKEKQLKKLKGFSLVESLIATFIFVMVVIMIMETFFSVIDSRRRVRAVQQDIEDARYAMEVMAKTLRMSSVFSSDGSNLGNIHFYDYSQEKCFQYVLDNTSHTIKVQENTSGVTKDAYGFVTGCTNSWGSGGVSMTNGTVNELYFTVEKSSKGSPKKLGHVTISMKVCYENDCTNNDSAIIQTSVSLRDYGYIKN
ncbi:MAG: hypothetical protein ACD_15C00204G0007 [uncultured bacterium]|nr:MAG: hypothetical protein ACD_15C00204G0007 [uncultured bacterium]